MADLAQDAETPLVQGTTAQQATNSTIKSLGDIIKLLPTGTYFLFTFLNPVFTNIGEYKKDRYIDSKGAVQYGLVTTKGIFAFADPDPGSVDLSKYKLRLGDFVHALISCFCPSFQSSEKTLIAAALPAVAIIAGSAFVVFPSTRSGIGYPARPNVVSDES